jgi:hypothetical protein
VSPMRRRGVIDRLGPHSPTRDGSTIPHDHVRVTGRSA